MIETISGYWPCLPTSTSENDKLSTQNHCTLKKFEVRLGPDLKAIYPLLLSLNFSGCFKISGPLVIEKEIQDFGFSKLKYLQPNGFVHLESGEVNLLAAQFRIIHEQPSKVVFFSEQGGFL